MTQPEILDREIRTLQEWLRAAWRQLGDPSLTAFARRELRNQMKQWSAELRSHLQADSERQSSPINNSARTLRKPEHRILV